MSAVYLVLDAETTGLNPLKNGLIQIAALAINSKLEVLATFNQDICPPIGTEFCPVAATIYSLTPERISKGRKYEEVCEDLINFIKANFTKKPIIIGQFYPFDYAFLTLAMAKCDFFKDNVLGNDFVDTKVLVNFANLKARFNFENAKKSDNSQDLSSQDLNRSSQNLDQKILKESLKEESLENSVKTDSEVQKSQNSLISNKLQNESPPTKFSKNRPKNEWQNLEQHSKELILPFPITSLSAPHGLKDQFQITDFTSHDALGDCLATLELVRKLIDFPL